MEQREYLQELCNRYGDFKVARTWKDTEGNHHWSKHRSVLVCWETEEGLQFLDCVNHRQILQNEIIIDLDNKPSEKKFNKVCDAIQKSTCDYAAYSAGRGYHIHMLIPSKWIHLARMVGLSLDSFRERRIKMFQGDKAKIHTNTMIALEGVPHWKTGAIKKLIRGKPYV